VHPCPRAKRQGDEHEDVDDDPGDLQHLAEDGAHAHFLVPLQPVLIRHLARPRGAVLTPNSSSLSELFFLPLFDPSTRDHATRGEGAGVSPALPRSTRWRVRASRAPRAALWNATSSHAGDRGGALR
jgi:hypothetical protein